MFKEIVANDEVKFNDLEKKIFKFVCNFGCLILRLILEAYDRKLMNARDTKKYRYKGLRKNTIKTIMGEVEYRRVMYEIEENVRKNKTTTSSFIATEHKTEGLGVHTAHIENNFVKEILKYKEISELKKFFNWVY